MRLLVRPVGPQLPRGETRAALPQCCSHPSEHLPGEGPQSPSVIIHSALHPRATQIGESHSRLLGRRFYYGLCAAHRFRRWNQQELVSGQPASPAS